MPTISFPPNTYDASCTVNSCLQQVVGILDSNPVAQTSACVSMFGSPVVTTVTPSVDVIFSTDTTTVSYTDIIVSLSIESSTVEQTVAVTTDVQETATVYSTTFVETVTTVVTAQPSSMAPIKKRHRRCGHGPSTTTPETTTSEPAVLSSTESAASTTLSPTALFPIASNCPSLEEYSSACSCISAVDSTHTVTGPASIITSVAYATVSTAIPSTSVSIVTELETKFITVTVTTTNTNTVTTATTTTATLTQTKTP